jgi:hypothetical protein
VLCKKPAIENGTRCESCAVSALTRDRFNKRKLKSEERKKEIEKTSNYDKDEYKMTDEERKHNKKLWDQFFSDRPSPYSTNYLYDTWDVFDDKNKRRGIYNNKLSQGKEVPSGEEGCRT